MLLPPGHVAAEALRTLVEERYGVRDAPLEFQPLGEDSWAFRCGHLWVSVRRDLRGHVPGAYQAATELRRAGLRRVLAPLPDAEGTVVHTVCDTPVVVFPLVNAVQTDPRKVTAAEWEQIVTLVGEVHWQRVTASLPTEDFRLGFEDDLRAALEFADGPAPTGTVVPRRLHALLRAHRAYLDRLCRLHRELAGRCAADDTPPVLTHGEPSAPNVLRAADGFLLADWGGARWGPPERDWFHLLRTFGDAPACRADFLRFYDVKWILSEVAEYATVLRRTTVEDEDARAMWRRLTRYLPEHTPAPDSCLGGATRGVE